MKAAVCYEAGKPLEIVELDVDKPGPDEVKVRIAATAVCHSDIHVVRGELPFPFPIVAGHESAGYVEEAGPGVTSVKRGDPVVVSLLISCGECLHCTSGRSHMCDKVWLRDTNTPFRTKKGEPVNQLLKIGSFGEYTLVHHTQCVPIPADMPIDKASMLACGVTTGFGAVVWRAKPEAGSSCAVIGAGGVGLNAIQGAALCGAYPVIAVDINDSKLDAARTFGATHVVNASKGDPIEGVKQLTGGRGVDYAFVTVGSSQAMLQSVMMSAPRGKCVWVGLPHMSEEVSISPFLIIREERTITGSYMGTTNYQKDIPKLIGLYKAGKLKLDELVTRHYRLKDINEAIDTVVKGKALRNIIMMD